VSFYILSSATAYFVINPNNKNKNYLKLSLKNISTTKRAIIFVIVLFIVVYIFCLPKKLFDVSYATVVTDRNGELLGARIADDEQWRFPEIDTVPEKFKICISEFEDKYYKYHWGVNPLAIGRALIQNTKEKRIVSGGSTLTMQVIRLSRNKNRTAFEKCIEMLLATRLEFRYSKEKILALYASHAPFGGNVVGIDAASWRYFGHSPQHLSWAEAATLAVLPNAPAMLHLAKNRDNLLKKRNRLLKQLHNKGFIDKMTYELALAENLPSEPLPLPQIAPHLVSLFHKNNKGEQSVSTIDKNLQRNVEDLLDRRHTELLQSDIRNIAAIVIDVKTNQVLVYCGNVRFNETNSGNQVDIIQADRSPGSVLKPILYYAMLQEGEILPNTLMPDIPMNINGFAPQNFNKNYEGAVPASEAVSRSLNIPLVYMLRTHSIAKFYNFLKERKILELPQSASHYGLSLILGAAEAKLGNIANAYSNMARVLLGLESTQLHLTRPSNFSEEEALYSDRKAAPSPMERVGEDAWEAGAVWQVFDAIKEVNRPEEIDWHDIPTMQKIAWKTGTSYGFRDAWAIGVTPNYVVGVWVGNASGEGKPNLIGARTAGPIMFDIFDMLPASDWFETPYGDFVEAEVCRKSGHLKGRFCEDVDTLLILPNGLRTDACPYHVQMNLTPDERFRVYENCIESTASVQRSWFVLPPAWEWFYKQYNPSYKSLPTFKPGCGEGSSQPMQFIYPQVNSHIQLPKQLDGTRADLTFELAHSKRTAVVFWHLNNEYIGSTSDFHKISVQPSAGKHSITAVDEDGNSISRTIYVEY
jgi:penicillin-binding protein 1C